MNPLSVPVHSAVEHRWELRVEEFEDGYTIRRYECLTCGAVRFE